MLQKNLFNHFMFRRNVRGFPRLPESYQEVEYLQSTGTQYIDTGIIITDKKWQVEFDSPSSVVAVKLGASTGSSVGYCFVTATGSSSATFGIGSGYQVKPFNALQKNTVYFNEYNGVYSSFSLDGKTYYNINRSTHTYPVFLFARNSAGTPSFGIERVYSSIFKSNVDDAVIQYLTPAIRKTDSVAGMYDTVNGTFTENAGTGSFIAGPYVNAEAWTPAELSPLAWYKGEDNALDSIGSANGTWTGTEAYVDGKIGGAFDLSANQTTIGLSNCDFNFSGEASFTITAWVNGSYWSEMQTIISHYGHDINKRSWRFVISSGILDFESMSTGIYSSRGYVMGGQVLTGKWVHVAVSIDGLMATLYVDGLSSATGIIASRFNTEKFVVAKIGAIGSSLDVIAEPFAAQIDDVLIFDKALTSTEITKLYNESVYRGGAAW